MNLKEVLRGKKQLKVAIVIILVVGTLMGVGLSYTIAIEGRKNRKWKVLFKMSYNETDDAKPLCFSTWRKQ